MSPLGLEHLPDDDDEGGEDEPQVPADPAPLAALDPVERIRRRQEHLAEQSTELFVLAEYDGELAIRYRRLSLEKARHALTASSGIEVERYAQFLIEACDEILRRDGDRWVPLIDGQTTTFNTIGGALGFDNETVRQDVLAVFGGHEHLVAAHGDAVDAWMTSARADDQDLLGG